MIPSSAWTPSVRRRAFAASTSTIPFRLIQMIGLSQWLRKKVARKVKRRKKLWSNWLPDKDMKIWSIRSKLTVKEHIWPNMQPVETTWMNKKVSISNMELVQLRKVNAIKRGLIMHITVRLKSSFLQSTIEMTMSVRGASNPVNLSSISSDF